MSLEIGSVLENGEASIRVVLKIKGQSVGSYTQSVGKGLPSIGTDPDTGSGFPEVPDDIVIRQPEHLTGNSRGFNGFPAATPVITQVDGISCT